VSPDTPDAEALYASLCEGLRPWMGPGAVLVGIWRGGAWLAERLQHDLALPGPPGVISSALHRDDFAARGMASDRGRTALPWAIDGAQLVLIDDVLHTGRTVRAVLNELYDFGRPASVRLAVLVDRGGRELPIEPGLAAARIALPAAHKLALARNAQGRFSLQVQMPASEPATQAR